MTSTHILTNTHTFSGTYMYTCSISGESKAIQLQRQLDQIKTEKFRTEAERDELKHKAEEAESQVRELYQKCRELSLENQEIPILRDSLEEMKYLQSKVVRRNYRVKITDGLCERFAMGGRDWNPSTYHVCTPSFFSHLLSYVYILMVFQLLLTHLLQCLPTVMYCMDEYCCTITLLQVSLFCFVF